MSADIPTYKLILVGDSGVGKTAFVKRHLTGHFMTQHIHTLGVDVYPIKFHTNYGPICFNVWDLAGDDGYNGQSSFRDGYYIKGDCVILMFDVTKKASYTSLRRWARDVNRVNPNTPTVVCGNKVDVKDRAVLYHHINMAKLVKSVASMEDTPLYFDISAKSNYNYEKPFLVLARQLTNHTDLQFVATPM